LPKRVRLCLESGKCTHFQGSFKNVGVVEQAIENGASGGHIAQQLAPFFDGAVERDEKGFIKTGHVVVNAPAWKGMSRSPGPLETSWPGIFAAGDVRSGSVKRCAAAVGEGGMAVEGVHEVLKTYA
jgi:thioredoxin reductase